MKREIAETMREIFGSPTLELARAMVRRAVETYSKKAPEFAKWLEDNITPLSKSHSIVKIALFGNFLGKFFDHMWAYGLKISQKNCSKMTYFSNQSEIQKRSIEEGLTTSVSGCLPRSQRDFASEISQFFPQPMVKHH